MNAKKSAAQPAHRNIERVQTGVRLEKRLLKVLKGLAEYLDLSLGDLLEGIALHALENKTPFKRPTLDKIAQLRRVYGFDLVAADSHRLREQDGAG
jgi:predicted DNA-binding ribbon-helix-helix protein